MVLKINTMEQFIAISLLLLVIITIVYSLYDLYNDKTLSKRTKVNWSFVIFLLPFTGSLIYFFGKMIFGKNKKYGIRQ